MGWIIFGAILLFFALILFCPIRIRLLYDGKLTMKAGIPLFGFRVYPDREADLQSDKLSLKQKRKLKQKLLKKKEKLEEKNKKAASKGKKRKTPLGESLKKGHKKGAISDLFRLFRVLRVLAVKLGNKLHIKIKRLEVVAASDDAAKTAYLFGALSQSVAYSLAALDAHTNLSYNNRRVAVRADFLAERVSVKADVRLSIRVGSALSLLFSALWLFAKETLLKNSSAQALDELVEQKHAASE